MTFLPAIFILTLVALPLAWYAFGLGGMVAIVVLFLILKLWE